jgi:hypothetical protein
LPVRAVDGRPEFPDGSFVLHPYLAAPHCNKAAAESVQVSQHPRQHLEAVRQSKAGTPQYHP